MFKNLNLILIIVFIFKKNPYNYNYISSLSSYWDIISFFSNYFLIFNNKHCANFTDYYYIGHNPALTNIMAFYHPVLLYIFISWSMAAVFMYKPYGLYAINIDHSFTFNYILVTLLFSSLWSSQEIFWNGFWNWDMVEISLFNFALLYLYSTHARKYFINSSLYDNYLFVVLIFFLASNKTSLIFSQHSFSSSFMFQINVLLYLIFIFFFIFKLLKLLLYFNFSIFSFYYFIFLIIYIYYVFYKYKYDVKGSTQQVQIYYYIISSMVFGFNYKILIFIYTNIHNFFIIKFPRRKNFIFFLNHYVFIYFIYIVFDFHYSYNYYFDYHTFFYKSLLCYNSIIVNMNSMYYGYNSITFFKTNINQCLSFVYVNNYDTPFLYLNSIIACI